MTPRSSRCSWAGADTSVSIYPADARTSLGEGTHGQLTDFSVKFSSKGILRKTDFPIFAIYRKDIVMSDYSKRVSESLLFRKADGRDIAEISAILKKAVERMLAEGKRQWNKNYPNEIHVRSDIEKGIGYVLEEEGKVVGYAAVGFTGEPAYDNIKGQWLSDGKYVVVHRLAVCQSVKGKGVGNAFMNAVEDFARTLCIRSFKIDTNFDNTAMLGLLDRLGFTYCGEINYEKGSRMAFEKLIY